jgi:hypothetical protein
MIKYLTCPKCGSTDLKKNGRHDKGIEHLGEPVVKCKKCGYKSYVTNFGGSNLEIAPISHEQRELEKQRRRNSHLDKTASNITKQRMSESHKQNPVAFWKDKKLPQSTRDKMSESHKGQSSWNKGLTTPIETRNKMSISMTGIKRSDDFRNSMRGENHPRWKGGITSIEHAIRELPEMYIWKYNVMKRDNFCDCFTGLKGNHNLQAHHIKALSIIVQEYNIKTIQDALNCEGLWDIDNGVTMFKDSHKNHHKKYGLKILPKEYYFQKRN